jgi:glutamate N-acetyltransferase/amino-acid N-acetyltransferase
MVELAKQHGIDNALVMSTGVIGPFLDMKKIESGIKDATSKRTGEDQGWESMSQAVMTTDTYPKLRSKSYQTQSGKTFRMAGFSKGAGMIAPNMGTMLSSIVTDAAVSSGALHAALKFAVDRSYNAVTVDGDTSTNDSLCVLANGLATPGEVIEEGSADFELFKAALTDISQDLAKELVRDGEGATKFITIHVEEASSFESAQVVAKSIANSALFKTAMHGEDANWGRILCAVGYAGEPVDPARAQLWFVHPTDESKSMQLVQDGQPLPLDEKAASALLKLQEITVRVKLGVGNAKHTMWTCDFSKEYVEINADYRS